MYHVSYAEVLSDSPGDTRSAERDALDHAIALLGEAEHADGSPAKQEEAVAFTNQLWATFIKDLARPDNDLPPKLRADLMSVGLGIMSETQRISYGRSRNFTAIAEICGIVRDGLA